MFGSARKCVGDMVAILPTVGRRLAESDPVSEVQDDSGTPIIMIAGIACAALLLSAYAIYLLIRHLRKHRRSSPELVTIVIERPE